MIVLRICIFLFTLVGLCLPHQAYSQACCSGGVPISSNLGLGSKEVGQLQFQLTYDYNTLRDLLSISDRLDDDSRVRNTHSTLLESSYDLSKAFSINALFSYVRQERIIRTLANSEDITINQGLGDAIFLVRYNLLHKKPDGKAQLLVGAGPKFPLGRADFTDERGIILPADLQPGTGAWDAILWGNYSYIGVFGKNNLTFNITGTARATSTNDRFGGRQAYKFGNEFQVQMGLQDRYLVGNVLIDPLLILRYRTVGRDQVDGNNFDNTGGHWVYLRPGLNVNIGKQSAVRLTGDIPLYRRLIGTQLTTSYRISLSFYHSISFRKNANTPFPFTN